MRSEDQESIGVHSMEHLFFIKIFMIDKLTKNQREKMIKVRDYWIDKVYNCEPTNEKYAVELVNFMYKLVGLNPPKVIFADSPLSAQIIVNLLDQKSVGASVGNSVRDSVGDSVWASVKNSVSSSVEDSVRDSVGNTVWASVGNSVRNSVRDSVRDSVEASISNSVRFLVWNSARNCVRDSVGDSVSPSVRALVRASVRNPVWDSVSSSVGDLAWNFVKDSAEELGISHHNSMWYGEVWAQGWHSFYDFFTRKTGIVKHKLFEEYIDLVDKANAYYILPFSDICIVTRAPKRINRIWHNNRWVMHNDEGGMSIEWGDGSGQYVLHGITLQKEDYEKILKGDSDFKEVVGIKNIDMRMLFLRYLEVEKLLKGSNAELINTGQKPTSHFDYAKDKKLSSKITYNELYLIKGIFNEDAYFLKYEDPSTGRVYLSGIAPEVGKRKDADLAMAWKHGISKEMYMSLKVQS